MLLHPIDQKPRFYAMLKADPHVEKKELRQHDEEQRGLEILDIIDIAGWDSPCLSHEIWGFPVNFRLHQSHEFQESKKFSDLARKAAGMEASNLVRTDF